MLSKATGDATHEFGGDDTTVVSRKHGEQLNIKVVHLQPQQILQMVTLPY